MARQWWLVHYRRPCPEGQYKYYIANVENTPQELESQYLTAAFASIFANN